MKILLICTALALAGCAADTGGGYATATDDIEQKLYEIKQQQNQQFWQLRMDQQQAESRRELFDSIPQLDTGGL